MKKEIVTSIIHKGFEEWYAGHEKMIKSIWTEKEVRTIKAAMAGAYMEGAMVVTQLIAKKLI